MRVRVVTIKHEGHRFKTIVPTNPKIDTSLITKNGERGCLKLNKADFDPEFEYVYLAITDVDRRNGKKEYVSIYVYRFSENVLFAFRILVHLFNWARIGCENQVLYRSENGRFCQLEFGLCKRKKDNNYEMISLLSYSTIIEDGNVLFHTSET